MNDKDLLLDNKLVKSKKDFKPYEAKIFYNALCNYTYNLRQNNIDNREIVFDTVDIKELMLGGKIDLSYERYKERLKSMNHYITLRENEKEETASMLSIISQIEIRRDKTIFILSHDLCELLKKPEMNFTPIKLIELSRLKSSFSIKAYDIISLYRNLKNGYYHMPVEKFKWFFNIKDSYRASHIDTYIIKPIEEEINKYTRFTVKITKVKKRNKITHYDFYIQEDKLFIIEEPKKEIKEPVDKPVKTVDKKVNNKNEEMEKWFNTVLKKYPNNKHKEKIKLKEIYSDRENVENALDNYLKDPELKINNGWRNEQNASTFFSEGYKSYIDSRSDKEKIDEYRIKKYGMTW
jgi:plasmid replication initiation protein